METPAVIYQLPRGVRHVIHDPTSDAAGKAAILARCRATLAGRIAVVEREANRAFREERHEDERRACGEAADLRRLARILARAHEEWRA